MEIFYEKNNYLLDHPTNKTFEDVLWMSTEEFREWCIELRKAVVYAWDVLGIPPRVGYNKEEIIDQFKQLTNYPVHEFLTKDELTGETNLIRNTQILGNAVNQWFPTMMKTRINYTEDDSDGKSIYDFFARDDLLNRFITYATRHFKRDSFYHYSRPVKAMDTSVYGDLPVTENAKDWLISFEREFRKHGKYDYWLMPVDVDKEYTGYNDELRNKSFLELTAFELTMDLQNSQLNGVVPEKCLTNIDYKDRKTYQIRVFELGQKLFPLGFKAFRVSYCQYAVNFPPLTAKWIYDNFTDKAKTNIIWDPSMGWGGRLLGALSAKIDRSAIYLGNDPNTDHNVREDCRSGKFTKYHSIHETFTKVVKRGGLFPKPHLEFHFWQLGSEVIQHDPEFQNFRERVDLVFTSPPYFAKEAYSDDPEQSYRAFSTWDAWVTGFLEPTLRTAYNWLRKGGHLLWNVSDVKFGSDMLPLVGTSEKICMELGFLQKPTLKMTLAQMPGGNRIENGIPKAKYTCKVLNGNGKPIWLKYEPILVFQKP